MSAEATGSQPDTTGIDGQGTRPGPARRVRAVRRAHRRRKLRHIRQRLRDILHELRYLTPDDTEAPASDLPRHIEAQLMKDYHRLEKGLGLRVPASSFGRDPHTRLVRDVQRAEQAQIDPAVVAAARDVLSAHDRWEGEASRPSVQEGGVVQRLERAALEQAMLEDPEGFFGTRHSIRDFDADDPPDLESLQRAVRLAQSTPSVCNRQAVSVNLYRRHEDIVRVLELQRGSRGFRELVPALFVVHVDTRLFTISSERNQRWMDGGLFAMTLVLALHSLGIASCMLNWAVEHDLHQRMRDLVGLPQHQDVVVLIAAGRPAATVHAARSKRRPLDQVMRVDPPLSADRDDAP